MGRRLREEEVMTIQVLHERGCSNREIARKLGIRESAVRYRLARQASSAKDRAKRQAVSRRGAARGDRPLARAREKSVAA